MIRNITDNPRFAKSRWYFLFNSGNKHSALDNATGLKKQLRLGMAFMNLQGFLCLSTGVFYIKRFICQKGFRQRIFRLRLWYNIRYALFSIFPSITPGNSKIPLSNLLFLLTVPDKALLKFNILYNRNPFSRDWKGKAKVFKGFSIMHQWL